MGVRMSDWGQKGRSEISNLRQNEMSTVCDFHSISIFGAFTIGYIPIVKLGQLDNEYGSQCFSV